MNHRSSTSYLMETVLPASKRAKGVPIVLIAFALSNAARAEDITIHLPPNATISIKSVQYQCDAQGSKIGVPSGPFPVEYINGGGNSLAVVPISGNSVIFSNVISGSGARYAAQQFIWWEAHGTATLYSDSLAGKLQSACQPAAAK